MTCKTVDTVVGLRRLAYILSLHLCPFSFRLLLQWNIIQCKSGPTHQLMKNGMTSAATLHKPMNVAV